MISLNFSRHSLCVIAATVLLAGCGAPQPPIGVPGAMPQSPAIAAHAEHGQSWMLPEAKGEDLLYADLSSANADIIYVFSYPKGKLVKALPIGRTVSARAMLGQ